MEFKKKKIVVSYHSNINVVFQQKWDYGVQQLAGIGIIWSCHRESWYAKN